MISCSFFLFGEEKKGTEKREHKKISNVFVYKQYCFLKFFWSPFLSRKGGALINTAKRKD